MDMANIGARVRRTTQDGKITNADILGTEQRTRRGRIPVPAGGSDKADGTPDYGLFGPGSMVWEVLLHPALVVFHHAGQQQAQLAYKPIEAGIRDWEPLSIKARAGTLTMFDTFERASRGAGMHLPMWLGDTPTAQHMATWLHKIHSRVNGEIIDVSAPELGGYDAAGPRESMWAALTELHPMLRMYEAFAFRDGRFPHSLDPDKRDQFILEAGAYLRLHGAPDDEIPKSMSDLAALYQKHAALFAHSATIDLIPTTGENMAETMQACLKKNFKISHFRALRPTLFIYLFLGVPVTGALSGKARAALGVSRARAHRALVAKKLILPLAWLLQRRPIERHFMRLMWGADGVMLFQSARALHQQAIHDREFKSGAH
jgi:uncharacterized protein (DUF2236 family)